ncbi:MAG: M20/M25/M40 family metallo-hydrolase [Erysipelotrichaceae bacterium]|nr:M20/M25/M40 family metallo-hydrolase [Erysipelotrichaceae bacterium]
MILLVILAIILILAAIVFIRTKNFNPIEEAPRKYEKIKFDEKAAVKSLAELVKCKTVSYYDHSKEDNKEFKKLIALLPKLYPNVCKTLTLKKFKGDRALLFHWKGKVKGDAAVFMAHFDVVPVVEDEWTKPAFKALIEDGVMWGRGTLDTKVTFNGIMSAAENLIKQGFKPDSDVYFAFSGGEEVSGPGAQMIVDYFKKNNINLSMVIDEGGAVVKDIFPGVKEECGLIGIAEKGLLNLKYDVKSSGGHASAPAPHTPVGILSRACAAVEDHPFKMHLEGPAALMFDTLGRRSTTLYKMIFANLWLFKPVLDIICKKSGGELNALVRTTSAFTQMEGSLAPNVVPPTASMVANLRLNPSDTIESAVEYINSVVKNPDVKVSVLEGENPSRVSRIDVNGYKWIKEAVEDTWRGCVVAPYLMVQCSDSRHYSEISDRVYRFSAMDLTAEERKTIHGNDEHIRIETIHHAVEFFMRVMKNC